MTNVVFFRACFVFPGGGDLFRGGVFPLGFSRQCLRVLGYFLFCEPPRERHTHPRNDLVRGHRPTPANFVCCLSVCRANFVLFLFGAAELDGDSGCAEVGAILQIVIACFGHSGPISATSAPTGPILAKFGLWAKTRPTIRNPPAPKQRNCCAHKPGFGTCRVPSWGAFVCLWGLLRVPLRGLCWGVVGPLSASWHLLWVFSSEASSGPLPGRIRTWLRERAWGETGSAHHHWLRGRFPRFGPGVSGVVAMFGFPCANSEGRRTCVGPHSHLT